MSKDLVYVCSHSHTVASRFLAPHVKVSFNAVSYWGSSADHTHTVLLKVCRLVCLACCLEVRAYVWTYVCSLPLYIIQYIKCRVHAQTLCAKCVLQILYYCMQVCVDCPPFCSISASINWKVVSGTLPTLLGQVFTWGWDHQYVIMLFKDMLG